MIDNVRQAIDAIVARFVDAGVIDDKAFAQTKARSLHRRGTSSRLTRQKLKMAGIDGATLDKAMDGLDLELDTNPAQREWRAAVALARRRRIGPFRQRTARITALRTLPPWRAVASTTTCQEVIDAADADSLDDA